MTTKKLPLYLDNTFESLYGNFGSRLASSLLEVLIMAPLTVGLLYLNSMRLGNYCYTFVVSQLVFLVYFIYLPVRYGATPGKRLMGLTILKTDGSAIGYHESFLKVLPVFCIAMIAFVIQSYCIWLADEATFNSLGWINQTNYLKSFSPIGYGIQIAASNGFYLATLVVFLMSDRKQSIGDQLAGTVVVHTRFLEKITAFKEEEVQ